VKRKEKTSLLPLVVGVGFGGTNRNGRGYPLWVFAVQKGNDIIIITMT
jgi:hypothetical protein